MSIRTDRKYLALTIYGEARGESMRGQVGVACTVMNRFQRPGWWSKGPTSSPAEEIIREDSVAAVCLQPYQFSCWNGSHGIYLLAREMLVADQIKVIADLALRGCLHDVTGGATHYYAATGRNAIPAPSWARSMIETATIGNHRFLREE